MARVSGFLASSIQRTHSLRWVKDSPSTVELGGKTATGIVVPEDVVAALGAGNRPPVTVTVGGHSYRTTVARMGERFLVPLSAENRTAAGVAAGDQVEVDIVLDGGSREVAVPGDLAAASSCASAAARSPGTATSRAPPSSTMSIST